MRFIETIFLDAGNTMVSMDFAWIRAELKRHDILCNIDDLMRAEAAARPFFSANLNKLKSTEGQNAFTYYFKKILHKLEATSRMGDEEHDNIIHSILPILQAPGANERLWSFLLPGVKQGLDILRKKGYHLVVVSNSDGTVEKCLENAGIRHYFNSVVDSGLVGFEKPDPRLFQYALELSGSVPEKTLHVGDMYHIDILGAFSAGMHAILIDPFDDWKDVDCLKSPDLLSVARMLENKIY